MCIRDRETAEREDRLVLEQQERVGNCAGAPLGDELALQRLRSPVRDAPEASAPETLPRRPRALVPENAAEALAESALAPGAPAENTVGRAVVSGVCKSRRAALRANDPSASRRVSRESPVALTRAWRPVTRAYASSRGHPWTSSSTTTLTPADGADAATRTAARGAAEAFFTAALARSAANAMACARGRNRGGNRRAVFRGDISVPGTSRSAGSEMRKLRETAFCGSGVPLGVSRGREDA